MKSKIKNALAKLQLSVHNVTRPAEVPPVSVTEVIADFNKKVDQLKGIARVKQEANQRNAAEIRRLEIQSDTNSKEAQRANAVASRLEALVN